MSTRREHLMRNFLSISDIARLSGYSHAKLRDAWKAGLIPWRNANPRGKQVRFIDSPEIHAWCEEVRSDSNDGIIKIIEATVLEIIWRDYSGDLDGVIVPEIKRQLRESKDPDQLLKKWARAVVDRRPEDRPHIDLAPIGSEILAEIMRQLLDSKDPGQLLKKWGRAIVDRRPDDLPHVL